MATHSMHESEHNSTGCTACRFQPLCLARGLNQRQTLQLEAITQNHQSLPVAQKALYWVGDEFRNIYAVRSGLLKTCTVDDEGHEHIRGFHLPGDLVGLDAIASHSYPSSAIAISASEVCMIPYEALTRVVTNVPALQRSMVELMSRDLRISLALSGDFTAEQRVAAFLLHFSQRMKKRGMASGNSIRLLMPRRDIAAYLRLAIETVSRVLGRFEREDWINVSVRDLQLLDVAALWQLAEPVGICEPPEIVRPVRKLVRRAGYVPSAAYA